MLTVPEFEHQQQGKHGLTRQRYLIAFINKLAERAPNVVEALRREVFEPHGGVLLSAVANSGMMLEDLERHALSLARPVFSTRHPGYDPLPEVLLSGFCFRNVCERDGLSSEFIDDSVTEDVAAHPECYPAQSRYLGMMSLRRGKGSRSPWMSITAADETCHPELVEPRKSVAKWANDHHLRTHPCDIEPDSDAWLFDEPLCEIAMSTVCEWASDGASDGEFYYSTGPAAPMPVCDCTQPRAPGWYTHSVIDCPAMVELYGLRPKQTLVDLVPDWPQYEPFPRHTERHQAHNRRYHSGRVEAWIESHLSREMMASSQSPFAAIRSDLRNAYIKQLRETDRSDCNRIDNWCLKIGLQRVPRPDAPLDDHVTWAVQFQVLGLSDYSIARSLEYKSTRPRKAKQGGPGMKGESPVSNDTVFRAVRRVLKVVGIKQRPRLLANHEAEPRE